MIKSNQKRIITIVALLVLLTPLLGKLGGSIVIYAQESDEILDESDSFEILKYVESPIPISTLSHGNTDIFYQYDDNNCRISKEYLDTIVQYNYNDNLLISEYGVNGTLEYVYEYINDEQTLVGFKYNDNLYYYLPDNSGNVGFITDENFNYICKYEYETSIPKVYELVNDEWMENTDPLFIGNINPIQYQYWYFDQESTYYYTGDGIYYDTASDEFIKNDYTLSDDFKNSSLMKQRDLTKTWLANSVADLYVDLLNDSSYGKYIDQVSQANWNNGKRWYDGLKSVEVVARCLFSENTLSSRNNDRAGVTVVIANRVNDTTGSYKNYNSIYSVVTQKSQFSGINPGSFSALSSTNNARAAKSSSSSPWENATMFACILYYTTNLDNIDYLYTIPQGISSQVQFYGCYSVYNSSDFTVSSGALYQNGTKLKNVAIAGVGTLTINSSSTKKSLLGDYYNSNYNLFYNYVK